LFLQEGIELFGAVLEILYRNTKKSGQLRFTSLLAAFLYINN